MKLILTGFMGAGKSSTGHCLANALGFEFVDMDEFILQQTSYSSIPEIFEDKGEAYFRTLEENACAALSQKQNAVIATGGKVGTQPTQLQTLCGDLGLILFLQSDFSVAQQRVESDENRPLFQNKEDAQKLYQERRPLYQRHADWTVNTNGLNAEEVAQKILQALQTPPNICTVVMANTPEAFLTTLETHNAQSEWIELRFDSLNTYSRTLIDELAQKTTKNTIFTCRRADEGGFFKGSESERLEILQHAAGKFSYIDVELRTLEEQPTLAEFLRTNQIPFLCSWHDFEGTPEDLNQIIHRMEQFSPNIYKVISTAQEFAHTTQTLQLIQTHSDKTVIALSMGTMGECTRKLSPLVGGFLTFATLGGSSSAPGQMSLPEMHDFYARFFMKKSSHS